MARRLAWRLLQTTSLRRTLLEHKRPARPANVRQRPAHDGGAWLSKSPSHQHLCGLYCSSLSRGWPEAIEFKRVRRLMLCITTNRPHAMQRTNRHETYSAVHQFNSTTNKSTCHVPRARPQTSNTMFDMRDTAQAVATALAQSARPPPTTATQRAPARRHCYAMRGHSHTDNITFPDTGRTRIRSPPSPRRRGAAAVASPRGAAAAPSPRGAAPRAAALPSACGAAAVASPRGAAAEGIGHAECALCARARRDTAERARPASGSKRMLCASHVMDNETCDH